VRILITALLLGSATPALADAAAAFRDGQWPVAVKEGRAEATTPSLIIAGRAQLAIAAYSTRDRAAAIELIGAAERDFDAALAKTPTSIEAQLQKAVVIGYHAKLTRSPGLAKDSRRRFEAIRSAHPDVALAWAGVAGWHGGAVATLGSFVAGMAMGARAGEVDPGFRQAIKLDPTNPIHRTVYAMTLLDLDTRNAAKAIAVLQGIGQLPARDAYEAIVRSQGVQLLAALKTGDAGAAQALARRLQAFGTLN
jgi:hypothetical protein